MGFCLPTLRGKVCAADTRAKLTAAYTDLKAAELAEELRALP